MMTSVIIPIFTILTVQLGINIGFAYLIKENFVKRYKIISYIVFIGFAISLPIMESLRLFLVLGENSAPDALALSFDFATILFRMWSMIIMITTQIIFNKLILKRIVINRHGHKARR